MRAQLKAKFNKAIESLKTSGASDERVVKEKNKYSVELGENIGPITEFGKCYSGDQLWRLFKYVGKYTLGLPSFGPNILRTMHVTAVMIRAIKLNKRHDDPEIVRLFALARHGEFERQKSYNLVKADMVQRNSQELVFRCAGLVGTAELNIRPGDCGIDTVYHGEKFLDLFEEEGGLSSERDSVRAPVEGNCSEGLLSRLDSLFDKHFPQVAFDDDPEHQAEVRKEARLKKEIEREEIILRNVGHEIRLKRLREEREEKEHQVYEGPKRPDSVSVGQKRPIQDESKGSLGKRKVVGNGWGKRKCRDQDWLQNFQRLLRMNEFFIQAAVAEGVDPRGVYKRKEHPLQVAIKGANAKSFGVLGSENIAGFMLKAFEAGTEERGFCSSFYNHFGTGDNGARNIKTVVDRAKKAKKVFRWSEWFCTDCKNIECECKDQGG